MVRVFVNWCQPCPNKIKGHNIPANIYFILFLFISYDNSRDVEDNRSNILNWFRQPFYATMNKATKSVNQAMVHIKTICSKSVVRRTPRSKLPTTTEDMKSIKITHETKLKAANELRRSNSTVDLTFRSDEAKSSKRTTTMKQHEKSQLTSLWSRETHAVSETHHTIGRGGKAIVCLLKRPGDAC
jgi:hypothetical protein